MCVKREGVGNLCGGLFTILMLIIMFSVAHRRFHELVYISLALIAITLTLCIIFAIFNAFVCKGEPLIGYWDSGAHSYNTRHHSLRYRNQNINNHNNNVNNGYNQQRVHVCAPPTMGGARLNIIYTIGQQQNGFRNNQTTSLSLPTERHSFAINVDNNNTYSSNLMPINANMSSRTASTSTAGYGRPHYFQFSPIITLIPNNSSDNLNQLIHSYDDYPNDTRLPLESDIINGLNIEMPDLPPLYHQLDVIPTDGPPTYEEAIEDKQYNK